MRTRDLILLTIGKALRTLDGAETEPLPEKWRELAARLDGKFRMATERPSHSTAHS
jgi:hypothetical protein